MTNRDDSHSQGNSGASGDDREPQAFVPPGVATLSEQQLETDAAFRFNYVAQVIGLDTDDWKTVHKNREKTEPFLGSIVERVYTKMFQYVPMKKHFLEKHHGFYGHAPESMDEVTLDHEQTMFRKMKLKEYFQKLSTADYNETFAVMMDLMGRIHTPHRGNPAVAVPMVQWSGILGYIDDLFASEISKLSDLEPEERSRLQRAYSKLFWIQNNMFLRHYQQG